MSKYNFTWPRGAHARIPYPYSIRTEFNREYMFKEISPFPAVVRTLSLSRGGRLSRRTKHFSKNDLWRNIMRARVNNTPPKDRRNEPLFRFHSFVRRKTQHDKRNCFRFYKRVYGINDFQLRFSELDLRARAVHAVRFARGRCETCPRV